ncbi:MAG: SHOCT domain-containing protein [Actinomycetota bacterium]
MAGAQIGSGGADPSVDQLERLQKLREQGVLTEDEFQAQKRKVLGS